jgi:hypothetical protein
VRAVFSILVILPGLLCAQTAEHTSDQHEMRSETVSSDQAPITITINPEARVSVILGGTLPPPVSCGQPATLQVRIINQGFVTSLLEAELVEDIPAGATLEFHPQPLTGVPEELRQLRITLTKPGLTDLTIGFHSHAEPPDLGGRDRIHFLMHCTPLRAPL